MKDLTGRRNMDMDRKPLIFSQDIPQTIRKTIQELAKVDRDEIVLRKENAEKGRDISDILLNTDEFTARRESRQIGRASCRERV